MQNNFTQQYFAMQKTIFEQLESILLANYPHHQDAAKCLAELGAPSLSLAVLTPGIASTQCYSTVGDAVDTAFQACSLSKLVNALATMKLIEEGHFKLASTLGELLPKDYLDIVVEGSPAAQRPIIEGITVKQLLSHTSGLSPGHFPGYAPSDDVPTMHQIISGENPANTPRFRLTSLPGRSFDYSGAGPTLLQLILESVTGKEYSVLMHDVVLLPLRMLQSFYNSGSRDGTVEAAAQAKAHVNGVTQCAVPYHHFPELAAAGLWSTPSDLIRLVYDVQSSLVGQGGLLRQDTAREMLTEVDGGMALGWEVLQGSRGVFGHSGSNDPGYRCMMVGFSDGSDNFRHAHSGIVAMTNSATGFPILLQVMQALSAIQGWPFTGYRGTAPQLGRPATESGDDWKPWIGTWKGEQNSYVLRENSHGLPAIVCDGMGEVNLLPAVDSRQGAAGGYTDFVFQSMPKMSIKLKDKNGIKRIKISTFKGKAEKLQQAAT